MGLMKRCLWCETQVPAAQCGGSCEACLLKWSHTVRVLDLLKQNGATSTRALLEETGLGPRILAAHLADLELRRVVVLHRDTTHDRRMGGLLLGDGTAVTLVALRVVRL